MYEFWKGKRVFITGHTGFKGDVHRIGRRGGDAEMNLKKAFITEGTEEHGGKSKSYSLCSVNQRCIRLIP